MIRDLVVRTGTPLVVTLDHWQMDPTLCHINVCPRESIWGDEPCIHINAMLSAVSLQISRCIQDHILILKRHLKL